MAHRAKSSQLHSAIPETAATECDESTIVDCGSILHSPKQRRPTAAPGLAYTAPIYVPTSLFARERSEEGLAARRSRIRADMCARERVAFCPYRALRVGAQPITGSPPAIVSQIVAAAPASRLFSLTVNRSYPPARISSRTITAPAKITGARLG